MSPLPFEQYENKAWPFLYSGAITIDVLCGGVPANENTAESWIKAKLKDTRSAAEVQQLVAETKEDIRRTHQAARREAAELEVMNGDTSVATLAEIVPDDLDEQRLTDMAVKQAALSLASLNMFKRTEHGILYIEGRQLKAALKEAVSVAANAGKISTAGWGNPDNKAYFKQLKGWFPEHVFVPEKTLPLFKDGKPVREPDGIIQKFIHTHRGDAIGYEEFVSGAQIRFHVKSDVDLSAEEWAMIWLTGQDQGVGASRSQGFGTYLVTDWERVRGQGTTRSRPRKAPKAEAK